MLKTVSSIANAIGALNYKGTWDANANVPNLSTIDAQKGDYYVVSVAGSTSLGGITTWYVGDWAVYNGSTWQRVEGGIDDPAPSLRSNSTSGLMQITGPAAASTRVMTTPDANFTVARTDTGQTFSGSQIFSALFAGTSYPQTSTSAGTSIIDTAISIPTGGGVSTAYLAIFSANGNSGGNAGYRGNGVYLVNISSDFSGSQVYQVTTTKLSFAPSGPFSNELTLTATSWDGSTDTATPSWFAANQQLRIKIASFGGTIGASLDFRLLKLL